MAKRRKVGNLLALAVLTLAAERPMHPYEMATTLRERGKDHSIKINWGSLYTVVGNLEKHGLLQATETGRDGRRPERTVYTITDAGRAELRDWMRELVGTYTKEYRQFEAALAELPILPPAEVAELLEQRERALTAEIDRCRSNLEHHHTRIPRLFLIEAEYDLAMMRAELDWTRSLRTELNEGTLPGIAMWNAFHERDHPPTEAEIAEQARREG